MSVAKPFLKWAGGKSQLLAQFDDYYPPELKQHKIKKYIEPFIGGGAVFFDVMQKFSVEMAYISDVNKDLILTYQVIQQNPDALLDFLQQYQEEYDQTPQEQRQALFLAIREHFNQQRFEINYKHLSDNWITRAAQLVFLNKTCFNGLFRLNAKGGFNVPYGKYKTAKIADEDNILAISRILQKTEIAYHDYQLIDNKVDSDSFVYFDPPYRPLTETASFTTYAGTVFNDVHQQALAGFYNHLVQSTQAKLMLSNSNPKNVDPNDDFFEMLYQNYFIHEVSASRAINCKGHKRGKVSELLITSYRHES